MTPVHYKSKVLPDGHLPLPADAHANVGDEVEVTIVPVSTESDEEIGRRQREEGLKMAGIIHSGKSDVSVRHDDYLYGKP